MARAHSPSASSDNALDLLRDDHERVLQLFSAFAQMENDEEDDDHKQETVEQACALLTIHAQIEEELFYPALRDVIDEQDLLDEAQVEHDMAKQLIAELEAMEPDEDLYDAKFTVLGEYVRHHVEEEQDELFPKAVKAALDLDALGQDLLERKRELMAEFGMEIDDADSQLTGFGRPPAGDTSAPPPRH